MDCIVCFVFCLNNCRRSVFTKGREIMFNQALDILSGLGILPAIQLIAVATAAIFLYRYFTDRS